MSIIKIKKNKKQIRFKTYLFFYLFTIIAIPAYQKESNGSINDGIIKTTYTT